MADLIDRQELISWLSKDPLFPQVESFGLTSVIESRPSVDAVPVVRCKDCEYFHYNKAYSIQGFPIMGNSVCDKWANGCRTDENGYCFLGERREDER